MADHCHENRGRSRTCPNATDGMGGWSHRPKVLTELMAVGEPR